MPTSLLKSNVHKKMEAVHCLHAPSVQVRFIALGGSAASCKKAPKSLVFLRPVLLERSSCAARSSIRPPTVRSRFVKLGAVQKTNSLETSFKGNQAEFLTSEVLREGAWRGAKGSRIMAFAKNPPAVETAKDSPTLRSLYPSISSHKQGYVKVSDLHTIYYEVFGNPNGKPAVFLHGGPGAGCTGNHGRFFDPDHYRIVLFDQRGCGKSTPRGCLEENDTWELVGDLEKLRKELGIDRWLVVGGSWGTTLALAYAQTHPERVSAMVLRAVCMMRKREIEWFYKQGADALFPFAWDQYIAHIPEAERSDLLGAYYRRLTSDDKQIAEAAAKSWIRWEMSLLSFSNVPVVIAWDGKEYKSLPMPVAASQPAQPAPSPSPSPSKSPSAAVTPKPDLVSNGSVSGSSSSQTSSSQAEKAVSAGVENGVNKNGRATSNESTSISEGSSKGERRAEKKQSESSNGNGHSTLSLAKMDDSKSKAEASANGVASNGHESKDGALSKIAEGSEEQSNSLGAKTSQIGGAKYQPSRENMRGGDSMSSTLAQARLESHYSVNGAFFEEDQLLKGVDRIRRIPTVAVQGRYDFVCPLKTAVDLHSGWQEMELRVVPNAGHSQYEPGITHEIITATDRFKSLDF